MNILFLIASWVALCGFVASVYVHVCSLMGHPNVFGDLAWGLHVGIFLCFFPALLSQRQQGVSKDQFWSTITRNSGWAGQLLPIVFAYAVINFILFTIHAPPKGAPHTEANDIAAMRGFSGHWMVFYLASYAMLRASLQPRSLT